MSTWFRLWFPLFGLSPACSWRVPRSHPAPETVVFIVLDTVRSETTSLCGESRPTTPVLRELVEDGWAWTCDATAPGTWTTPSHVSFFTGKPVVELDGGRFVPAPADTLTGQFAARGFRTAMVAANMVLAKPDWLAAGFEHSRIAKNFAELDGMALADAVGDALNSVKATDALFLFVNIADAHAPYPAVPEGVVWAQPQRPVQHRMWSTDLEIPFHRYVSGRMPDTEAPEFRAQLDNGYAWAVSQADRTLGLVLARLASHGRNQRLRVVITSDHGEFVGEHGQVGHGDTLYEQGQRVPLLYFDNDGPEPNLGDRIDARYAFHLLRDGELPMPLDPPTSVAFFQPSPRTSFNGAATWNGATKTVWRAGTWERYDLASDPSELHPVPITPDLSTEQFRNTVAEHLATIATLNEPDNETTQNLRAAGYVE